MSCIRFLLEHSEVCWISTSTQAHEQVNLASYTPLIPMKLHLWSLNRLLTALTSSVRALLFRHCNLAFPGRIGGRSAGQMRYERHDIFFEVTHSTTKRKWQAQMIQNHICKWSAIFSTRTGIQLPQNRFCSVAWQESLLLHTIHNTYELAFSPYHAYHAIIYDRNKLSWVTTYITKKCMWLILKFKFKVTTWIRNFTWTFLKSH